MALFLFKLALFFYLLGTVGYIIYLVSQKKPLAHYAYGVLWAGFLPTAWPSEGSTIRPVSSLFTT